MRASWTPVYKIPGGRPDLFRDDMARFEAAILADKLVQRATRDLMWTILKPTEGKPSRYALGWFVAEKFGLRTAAIRVDSRGRTPLSSSCRSAAPACSAKPIWTT